jgi:hypothetical protein
MPRVYAGHAKQSDNKVEERLMLRCRLRRPQGVGSF